MTQRLNDNKNQYDTNQYHHLYIITGASRGFGLSLVQQVVQQQQQLAFIHHQTTLLLTARQDLTSLKEQLLSESIDQTRLNILLHSMDQSTNTQPNLTSLLNEIPCNQYFDKVTLINNAGSLGRLERIDALSYSDYDGSLQLNLVAPLTLTSMVLHRFKETPHICIVNVSSLAA